MRYVAKVGILVTLLALACGYARYNVREAPNEATTGANVETLVGLGWDIDRVTGTRIEASWERWYIELQHSTWEIEMRIVVDGDKVLAQCMQREPPGWYARPCVLADALARIDMTMDAL